MLYGTTRLGASGWGTIFRIAPDGSGYTILHMFNGGGSDGGELYGGLSQASDGMLYGATFLGGPSSLGTIFRMGLDGSNYSVLHFFTGFGRANPFGGLIQASDGLLYGTTYRGGFQNTGGIFSMALDGSGFNAGFFNPQAASYPLGGLIQGNDGMLYGTTSRSSPGTFGTVFRLPTGGGAYTLLHTFTGGATDGSGPWASPIQANDGTFYGTTYYGGNFDSGVVYQLTFPPPPGSQ